MAGNKKWVLIVDDTPENLSLLRQLLQEEYHVKTVCSGEDALRSLEGEVRPDLILLDVVMPGIDGYEVCRQLKSNPRSADIPVVFLTVRTDEVDEEMGFKVGGADYVTKPFSPPLVLARVRNHLELKEAVDVLRQKNAFLEQEVMRRQSVEQALLQANHTLECTNRELQAFDYSVSHDLRAPLRHINGFGKILREDYAEALGTQGRDYLERIIDATEKVENMVEGLLDLSRLSRAELNLEQVDLTQIAIDAIADLRRAEPDRVLDVMIKQGITVYGDKRLLRIVLMNLLTNAWKFTRGKEGARIEFDLLPENGKMTYMVRDNGAGFDMDHAGKLFVPFQRLHSAQEYPGTGIGLATVSRIIRRHGGEVWAESTVGQGAAFTFSLPTEAPPFEYMPAELAVIAANDGLRPTVLVIDDAPDMLTLLGQVLKTDYVVKVANNGRKGLSIAMNSPHPDIILLDVLMPELDGYEVCRRLKEIEETKDIPVIFLTGKTELQDEAMGLGLGAVDYITKPLSPAIVLARLRVHLQMKMIADCLACVRKNGF